MRYIILTLLPITLTFFKSYAQGEKIQRNIEWAKEVKEFRYSGDKVYKSIGFEGAAYDHNKGFLPFYAEKIRLEGNREVSARFTNQQFEPVAHPELLKNNKNITTSIEVSARTVFERKQPYALIEFLPIRRNNATGVLEQLVAFDLVVDAQQVVARRSGSRSTVTNSALSAGGWWKIAVKQDGVYKLSFDFLQQIGMDVDNLNPANLRVYGNGGGLLPEANDQPRIDDLRQNAIFVSGESDGSFDAGDFVLFYGQSPDRWTFDENKGIFLHQKHYSDSATYYFITASFAGGLRITEQPSLASSTLTVNSFDDFAFFEEEQINLIQSGRRWYGAEYNLVSESTHPFSFPNIDNSKPANVNAFVAGRMVGMNSTFTVAANGTSHVMEISSVSSNYEQPYADATAEDFDVNTSNSTITVTVKYNKPASSATGWLNYLAVNAHRKLILSSSQMTFRSSESIGNAATKFEMTGSAATIWDVTDPTNVRKQGVSVSGNTTSFIANTTELKEFVAFDNSNFLSPGFVEQVVNQNLHGQPIPDLIIVTHPNFMSAAEDLANYHRDRDAMDVLIVTPKQIYNEFSSGAQDVSAIRDFVKMFYDRASNEADMPRYLQLIGNGTYDYLDRISGNTNFVPTFETVNSLDPVNSFNTDDFFAFLDDNEGGNMDANNPLDIAVGRLPVKTLDEARGVVAKIKNYTAPASMGNWRNIIAFVADDEDNNIHVNSADDLSGFVAENFPVYNIDKIYFDSYPQEATPGGSRYPDANDAFNTRMYAGALIINYTGHGGVNGWAHERVLTSADVSSYENYNRLPLYVTATCEFSRYDDPAKNATGVQLLLSPKGGAIALMTTVRLVYSSSNANINRAFFESVFNRVNGELPTMGEVMRAAKNGSATGRNNRKFTLLGDPALKLAYPEHNVVTTSVKVNGAAVDTLKALAKVTITGQVQAAAGGKMTNFDGVVYPTIYDKPLTLQTLQNDPNSKVRSFSLQKNIIYKGKASVSNGDFTYTFIVPKDISYKFDTGKISYYAENGVIDANGMDFDYIVGGTAESFEADDLGPEVKLFMNDEKFAFGSMTNESPVLLVKLADNSGINTAGNGIGHDITAVLDDKTDNTIVLNEFYEAELNSYQAGAVEYPLSELEDGPHRIAVKAWDVYNNSGEGYTEFVVVSSEDFALDHVLNYPNPFTTSTNFFFQHNRPGQNLHVNLRVYTVAGKVVKTIDADVSSEGFLVNDIHWDGLDDYGDKIGKGVYVYKMTVWSEDGIRADKIEKLVILR